MRYATISDAWSCSQAMDLGHGDTQIPELEWRRWPWVRSISVLPVLRGPEFEVAIAATCEGFQALLCQWANLAGTFCRPAVDESMTLILPRILIEPSLEMLLQNPAPLVHSPRQPQPRRILRNNIMLLFDPPQVRIEFSHPQATPSGPPNGHPPPLPHCRCRLPLVLQRINSNLVELIGRLEKLPPLLAVPPLRPQKQQALAELVLVALAVAAFARGIKRVEAKEIKVDGFGVLEDDDPALGGPGEDVDFYVVNYRTPR